MAGSVGRLRLVRLGRHRSGWLTRNALRDGLEIGYYCFLLLDELERILDERQLRQGNPADVLVRAARVGQGRPVNRAKTIRC